jgi:ribosome biogenesis protein Tsr3
LVTVTEGCFAGMYVLQVDTYTHTINSPFRWGLMFLGTCKGGLIGGAGGSKKTGAYFSINE